MPVDKFGGCESKLYKSSGVSHSYINNNFLKRDGTSSAMGSINMAGYKLINVGYPDSALDVANKSYVDSSSAADRVSKSGDAMTGNLAMNGNRITGLPVTYPPSTNDDATSWYQALELIKDATKNNSTIPAGDNYLTNKKYVDDQDALKVSKSGDTMSGVLNMGNHSITYVLDPTNAQDVATKIYVDRKVASVKNIFTYQTSTSAYPPNPISGDWLIVTSDDGSLKEQWIYDGTGWISVQGSKSIENLQSQINNLPSSTSVVAAVTSINYSVTSAAYAGSFRVSFWTGYNSSGTLLGYADFGYGAGFNGSGSTNIYGIPSTWKSCTIKNNLAHNGTPPSSVQFYNAAGQAILTKAITNVNGAANAQITGNIPAETIDVAFA